LVKIKFWKMHGLGNDYIIFKDWNQEFRDYADLAKEVCRRRFSVGADGVIVLCKPSNPEADIKMRIFNADGSEAEMCGNGIRCLAKYAYENSITKKAKMKIETLAGLKTLELELEKGIVEKISVDMGRPQFNREALPMEGTGTFVEQVLKVQGEELKASCLSIGNPHCVIFVDDVKESPVEVLGPAIENHPLFPKRVNVEFVEIMDRHNLNIRVWERGCGETLACGTGACASVVVAHKLGKVDDRVAVHLRGGELKIEVGDRVYLKGPAVKVYEGRL